MEKRLRDNLILSLGQSLKGICDSSLVIEIADSVTASVLKNTQEKTVNIPPLSIPDETEADKATTYDWSEKVATVFFNNLTDKQKWIIGFTKSNNGKATLTELIQVFKDNGLKSLTNDKLARMIGGSTARLTYKCKYTYKIPILWRWDDKGEYYYLHPFAMSFLNKHF
jgi:hypothetical protein